MVKRSFLPFYLDLPVIDSLASLADEIHLSKNLIASLVERTPYFYREFTVKKKSGGTRTIAAPSRELKAVQAWILRRILDRVTVTESATAFRTQKSVADNAAPHVGNNYVLRMDLVDFFGSIPSNKIYTVFSTLGYNTRVSRIFANLCTYEGYLPQGAVTSPSLSNIVCIRMDRRIVGYTSTRNISYTRYADDMTFSSTNLGRLIGAEKLVRIISSDEGYTINESKTRLMGPGARRVITGLVLSGDGFGLGRQKERTLRAKIHQLINADPSDPDYDAKISHLVGWFAYLRTVDRQRLDRLQRYVSSLALKNSVSNPFNSV